MLGGEIMLNGIDISRWQDGINVGQLDVDFVICKATEGNGYTDPNCDEYYQAAKAAGKKLGVYHYARPDLGNTPEAEANWFISQVKGYVNEAILILDWEPALEIGNVDWAYEWLAAVYEKTGVRPLIYMSASPANDNDWSRVVNGNFGLWIASYGANTGASGTPPPNRYWPFYVLWQYTSRGHIPGYSGNLDLNYFYGTRQAWDKYAKSGKEDGNGDDSSEDVTKYQVGDTVHFNYLYTSSYGDRKVTSAITSGEITRIIPGRVAPYLINNGSGWVSDSLITGEGTSGISVGTRVRTIGVGNGASDGSKNPARIGIVGTVSRIIPGAEYPYLVATTAPLGWYKLEDLEII